MLKTHPGNSLGLLLEGIKLEKSSRSPTERGRVGCLAGGWKELGVRGQALLLPLSTPRAGSEAAGLLGPREAQRGLAGPGARP